jgi:signal transduction histidine kinase
LELIQTFASQAVIAIENVRLFNETKESLERQTATAEILKVISSSPTDVQPVFEAIAQSASALFRCDVAILILEGEHIFLRTAAGSRATPERRQKMHKLYPIPYDVDKNMASRVIAERRTVEVLDTEAPDNPPLTALAGRAGQFRSLTMAPLQREGAGIGVISLLREEPGFRLDEKQLSLLKTFADQAVIAIENVRLFKELQQRIEQMTALGEVGQAISSTLDIETVLKTIVSRAVQLARLDGGSIYEYDERAEEFNVRATENVDEEYLAVLRSTPIRRGEGAVGRAALEGEPVQIPDVQDSSYQSRLRDALIRAGYRAVLVVPLRREEQVIGALSVTRKTPGAFAPEVVELLKTFATQSAMAIQNARLFREIAEKGKQLEVASRHKSDFLASMSHELRTPLNAILGFNEMILGQVYGDVPADMQEPLEDIQKSGKHLLRLINNVLDLAKIEAGRMELSLQDYSVQDTVESVRATLRPLAAEKGLEFLASVPQDLPLAYGDSGRITQCLMNLAGNSLKFTRAGKVEIAVTEKDGLLTYRVTDTGVGIPPDKIGSLFTEFKQTDATIASEYGGTGLGLSISKKFVEMHGGRIWIESELGKGSAFIFEIPLRVKTE